jgi:hypothetical protein
MRARSASVMSWSALLSRDRRRARGVIDSVATGAVSAAVEVRRWPCGGEVAARADKIELRLPWPSAPAVCADAVELRRGPCEGALTPVAVERRRGACSGTPAPCPGDVG